jgi:MFS family permease
MAIALGKEINQFKPIRSLGECRFGPPATGNAWGTMALMPNQVGIAAALFSNTANAGFLLSGLTAGAWAQAFGYRSMFIACAVLSGLGLLLLHFQPMNRCT